MVMNLDTSQEKNGLDIAVTTISSGPDGSPSRAEMGPCTINIFIGTVI